MYVLVLYLSDTDLYVLVLYLSDTDLYVLVLYFSDALPGWLNVERVRLMTWWLWVGSPVEATFLSGLFSPLTSAEACEKSSWWLWKEKMC